MLPTIQKGHRFLELDSLRGLAALAVVFQHYRNALGDASPPVLNVLSRVFGGGRAAVFLFFLLSGFVLTASYRGPRRPTYSAFLVKRICRIYLPYVVAIILAAIVAARYYSTARTGNSWIDLTWSRPYSPHLLLQHLLMLGHYDSNQLNTAIWTLVIEMRVSIIFPVIVWLTFKLQPWRLVSACTLGTVILANVAQHRGVEAFGGTLFCAFFFVAGSILFRNHSELHAWLTRSKWSIACAALAGYLCYQLGEFIPFTRWGLSFTLGTYLQDWVMGLGAVLILMAVTSSNPLRHALHGKPILWCGARSYSIYLLHATVLFFLIRRFSVQSKPWQLIVVFLIVVFSVSEIFYRTVEVPALTLGRKLGRRSVENKMLEGPAADRETNDQIIGPPAFASDL